MTDSGADRWARPATWPPSRPSGEARRCTTAADVYGLGAILYELLTGRPPFRGRHALDTLLQVQDRDEPAAAARSTPQVDRDLETICLKCLDKEPTRRYASAEALAEDLERWLRGEPIAARPSTPAERLAKWARRRPAVAGLAAAVVLVAAAGLGGVLWQWRNALGNARDARDNEGKAKSALARDEATTKKLKVALNRSRLNAYIAHIQSGGASGRRGRRTSPGSSSCSMERFPGTRARTIIAGSNGIT